MAPPEIVTPRGSIIVSANGKAELKWNTDFKPKWQRKFSEAQQWLDNEVLKDCEPYIPMRTGMLIKSGILGSVPGQGFVAWIAPYARYQYYMKREPGSIHGALRGPQWFTRAKAVYLRKWIKGYELLMKGSK